MKKVFDEVEEFKKDYEEYKEIESTLEEAKKKIGHKEVCNELDKLIDYVRFNQSLSVSCMYSAMLKLKGSDDNV